VSVPPPAIIERSRQQCLQELPFWEKRARGEGIWSTTNADIDSKSYWIISTRCREENGRQEILATKYTQQIRATQEREKPDRFAQLVPAILLVGAVYGITNMSHSSPQTTQSAFRRPGMYLPLTRH
jgi:hypothetical protein